ncbi:MAG TPA: hypothetical protein VK982_07535 [Bacteroidales bacterium]|nr:hypothetical protein [Bacteroidales bacterium]
MTTKQKTGVEVLKTDIYQDESLLVGLFWNDPDLYSMYAESNLNHRHFGNAIWSFYFYLGRKMYNKGIRVFDDITSNVEVSSLNLMPKWKQFGEYETIHMIMQEVDELEENVEAYIGNVKKYSLLRALYKLFGERVIRNEKKYNYKKMTASQIGTYWHDKVNTIMIESDFESKEYDLLDITKENILEMDDNPDIGMELYGMKEWTEIFNGWAFGTITLLSAFSGNGKTSLITRILIISCILNKEKLLIMANETAIKQMKKLLLITIMGLSEMHREHGYYYFNRKNIDKGDFSEKEKERLFNAVDWIEEQVGEARDLIKFVPLESYTIDNVEKIMRKYAHRGYKRQILDTAKPTDEVGASRWELFVEQFDMLEKIVGEDTGLNIALWCNVQSADDYKKNRFLDELCLADGRKIKNVVDTTYHIRSVFRDEREGGKNELAVNHFFNNDYDKRLLKKNGWIIDPEFDKFNDKPYKRYIRKLDHERTYYLLFTSKNRRGLTNLTGLDVLVMEVDLNSNTWKEVGWTLIERDYAM